MEQIDLEQFIKLSLDEAIYEINDKYPGVTCYIGARDGSSFFFIGTHEEYKSQINDISKKFHKESKDSLEANKTRYENLRTKDYVAIHGGNHLIHKEDESDADLAKRIRGIAEKERKYFTKIYNGIAKDMTLLKINAVKAAGQEEYDRLGDKLKFMRAIVQAFEKAIEVYRSAKSHENDARMIMYLHDRVPEQEERLKEWKDISVREVTDCYTKLEANEPGIVILVKGYEHGKYWGKWEVDADKREAAEGE